MFKWIERRRRERALKRAAFGDVWWSNHANKHGIVGPFAVLLAFESWPEETAFACAYAREQK